MHICHKTTLLTAVLLLFATVLFAQHENCHETAGKLGGNLTLDPDYKEGCRFILTLPK